MLLRSAMAGHDHDGYEEDKAAWAEAARRQDAGAPSSRAPGADAKLTTEEADIPMSAIRGGSKKKALVVGVLAIVGVAGGVAGFGYWQNQRARGATETAFGELSQCLVGEPVASSAEIPTKFRRHQVALMGREPADRTEGGEPWPERCATAALKVVDASEDAGLESEDGKSLYAAADELATTLKEKRALENDITDLLRNTWEQAEAAQIVPTASSVAGPPSHKDAMVVDDIPDTAFITKEFVALTALHSIANPSEERWLFADQKAAPGPFLCRVEKERLLCKKAPADVAKLSHAVKVIGSSDPGVMPLMFAGNRGDAGIYRGDGGGLVDKLGVLSAYARKDGVVVALGVVDNKMTLSIQRKPGESSTRYVLEDEVKPFFDGEAPDWGNGYYTTMVAHDFLYVRIWKDGDWSLYAFPLGPDGRPRKPTKIGALPGLASYEGSEPGLVGCRTADDQRVVQVRQSRHNYVAFLLDGTWSSPVKNDGAFGREMDCAEGRATFQSGSSVTACTSAGCESYFPTMKDASSSVSPRSGANDSAIVGDSVVTVWGAGLRGGIRARRAPLADSAKTTESSVLFDDLVAVGGKLGEVSTVTELRVLPAGSSALVLLQTSKGLAAMRIGADGAFTPENVVWE